MKVLRYALYAIGALVVLFVIAVAIVVAVFDPNDYKPQIVQMVTERTGRTLTIDGDIKLKVFPKIGAALGRTTLSERDGGKEFAGVDGAQVYLALLPLLGKQVVVDEVRLDGLRAHLVKYRDGTTNFSDLAGGSGKTDAQAPPEAPAPEAGARKPVRIDISGVRVSNSRVTWRDETNGNDVAVELQELKTGRLADGVPTPVSLSARIQGANPKADLLTRLTGTLTFDLAQQQYRFKDLDAKLDGSALDFSGIAAGLKADIQADGATQSFAVSGLGLDAKAMRGNDHFDVKLTAPSVQSSPSALAIDELSVAVTGTIAGIDLAQSSLKVPKLHVDLAANQVLVDGLALLARGKMGADDLDVNLTAPRLEVDKDRASGESAQLIAKLAGAQRNANVVLKLSAMEGSAKALRIAALTVDMDAKEKDSALKGTLSTPISGNLEARVFDLPKIAASFTVTSRAIPQKTVNVPLSGSVHADLGKERVSADIAAKFDESAIKAKLALAQFAAPVYGFDVDIDKLDIDRYLPPKKKAGEEGSGEPGSDAKGKTTEEPIDFSALKTLNLDGKVRIGSLVANNIKAGNVRVDLRAKGGKLDIDPMQANLYRGSLKGSASVNANTNQLGVKQSLVGIDIGPLLRDAIEKDILEGRGSIALDVSTAGNTVGAFKRALNGNARLDLKDGAIKGVDLAGAIRNVKVRLGAADAEQGANQAQKTDFSELTASFVIKNGVAHNSDLNAKSPFLRISGEGDVHIPEDRIDYVVKASVVGTTAGQGGKERAQLTGLTLPVRISGPYTALKYKLEFSQMFSGAGADALKETAKEALKGAGKEQLKDLGKALLGGGSNGAKSGTEAQDAQQGQQAAPAKRPEDELKDKLKGLFR
jgi:AsmA protein